jgi:hypothetical protein
MGLGSKANQKGLEQILYTYVVGNTFRERKKERRFK